MYWGPVHTLRGPVAPDQASAAYEQLLLRRQASIHLTPRGMLWMADFRSYDAISRALAGASDESLRELHGGLLSWARGETDGAHHHPHYGWPSEFVNRPEIMEALADRVDLELRYRESRTALSDPRPDSRPYERRTSHLMLRSAVEAAYANAAGQAFDASCANVSDLRVLSESETPARLLLAVYRMQHASLAHAAEQALCDIVAGHDHPMSAAQLLAARDSLGAATLALHAMDDWEGNEGAALRRGEAIDIDGAPFSRTAHRANGAALRAIGPWLEHDRALELGHAMQNDLHRDSPPQALLGLVVRARWAVADGLGRVVERLQDHIAVLRVPEQDRLAVAPAELRQALEPIDSGFATCERVAADLAAAGGLADAVLACGEPGRDAAQAQHLAYELAGALRAVRDEEDEEQGATASLFHRVETFVALRDVEALTTTDALAGIVLAPEKDGAYYYAPRPAPTAQST